MARDSYSYNGAPLPHMNSSVPASFEENGRWYGNFKRGQYLLPVDEDELDRLDIFHKFFLVSRQASIGGLHEVPLPPGKPRILDLGCGTGIWTIDMADRYPSAKVIGWDLNYTQPSNIPVTVEFHQRDMTDPHWDLEPNSFDLVHMRMLAGSIKDWRQVYSNSFKILKPGGIFEHVEIDFRPQCSDGSLPPDSRLRFWARELYDAFDQIGQSMTIDSRTEGSLQQTGFVDVKHYTMLIPFHPWPDNEHEKDMGRWFNLGMTQGLYALTAAPLTRIRGYTQAQVLQLIDDVKREICTRSLRAFCTMHIFVAKKPDQPRY